MLRLMAGRQEFGSAHSIGGLNINGSVHVTTRDDEAPLTSIMLALKQNHGRQETSTTDVVHIYEHHREEDVHEHEERAAEMKLADVAREMQEVPEDGRGCDPPRERKIEMKTEVAARRVACITKMARNTRK